MSTKTREKRITVKYITPNPLFEKWLTEWHDKAKENNSKMQFTFSLALKNLKKYPLPLKSGKECIILKGFGNKLCDMLDKKLKEHKHNVPNDNIQNNEPQIIQNIDVSQPKRKIKSPKVPKSTKKTSKVYNPAKGSGAYAILVTLIKKSQEIHHFNGLSKNEIIEYAKNISDKSFVKPDSGSFYTAWSSMSTLVSKGLVLRKGNPPKFSLSEEGEIVAVQLVQEDNTSQENQTAGREKNINSVINEVFCPDINEPCTSKFDSIINNNPLIDMDINTFSSSNENIDFKIGDYSQENQIKGFENANSIETNKYNSELRTDAPVFNSQSSISSSKTSRNNEDKTSSQDSNLETIIFAPNTFDVILLVDTQETAAGPRNPLDDETISELNKYKVKFEVRHLKVGDFTWICRNRETKNELVLPYIVERKRMDDLGHSIKDGRFHEQKYRLKQCGIQNLIYIVESYGNNTRTALPLSSLLQAATNTLIQDQFQVKFTENHRHSMQYLSAYTLMLQHIYESKTVMSCSKENLTEFNVADDLISLMTFKDFNKGASKTKNFKVKDIFTRQLLQVKGISVEKALAIIEKYPTPKLLKTEYDCLTPNQGEKLLSNITFGPLKKFIGPVISKTIYQLYTLNNLS